jgi:small subunit ribosomal protein S20
VANIKSQIKRNRQNDKRRLRNRVYRGTARIAVRSARSAIDAGVPESTAALGSAISALDKAATKGVLHKNNAARRKSRLMKAFAKMEPVSLEAVPETVEMVKTDAPKKVAAAKTAPAKPKAEKAAKKAPAKKSAATSPAKAKKTPASAKKSPAKK